MIFRDGFEAGGNGAQRSDGEFQSLATLDDANVLSLDSAQAPPGMNMPVTWIDARNAQGRHVFRIDVLRSARSTLVRIVSDGANGNETATVWMQTSSLAFGVAGASGSYQITVATAAGTLHAAVGPSMTLPLNVYMAH